MEYFSSQKNREFKLKYLRKLFDNNNILCFQEVHGKDEYLQAIQVLVPRFRFFGTFIPGNENAGGSAVCIHTDLLPEDAIVTHMITCQGRDHIVNVQYGRQSPVIVNVHFEPELTLRRLRERLRLITPHWPSYPNAVGIISGDFNICEPQEGRVNVWNQTFTDGDAGKTALFQSFSFHMFLRLLNLITLGGTPHPLGSYALYQGLIASLLTYQSLTREIFTATPPCLRELGEPDHSE